MQWASSISEQDDTAPALERLMDDIDAALGAAPDLVVAFLSPHHADNYTSAAATLAEHYPRAAIAGCSAEGVIGRGEEVEHSPALSLTAASMPGAAIRARHLDLDELPDDDASPRAWRERLDADDTTRRDFILLSDPFTPGLESLIAGLDYAFPESTKIGGIASGAREPGGNALIADGHVHDTGAVLVEISGNARIDAVVAQGCRPIGAPLRVTRSQRNILLQFDRGTPLKVLQDLAATLSDEDKELFRQSLFLGIEMDPLGAAPKQGDFLIRNLIHIDPQSGACAVAEHVHDGQVVQFHLRDRRTSSDDLVAMLDRYCAEGAPQAVRGALLFSCLGRGAYLYGKPNHDTELFERKLGAVPLGGFFCNGEIGPVRGATYVHGYTSSFGLFRPA